MAKTPKRILPKDQLNTKDQNQKEKENKKPFKASPMPNFRSAHATVEKTNELRKRNYKITMPLTPVVLKRSCRLQKPTVAVDVADGTHPFKYKSNAGYFVMQTGPYASHWESRIARCISFDDIHNSVRVENNSCPRRHIFTRLTLDNDESYSSS